MDDECESEGLSIAGKVFCFPYGKGSTVGSYAMYQLRLNGVAPSAIINGSAEPIVATGAIIAEIPMIDGIDVALLRTGDSLSVDADDGSVTIGAVSEKHVVTSILKNRDLILLLQRSDKVGSYRGQWAGVSGYMEAGERDERAARREMKEETGNVDAKLIKRLEPQRFRDASVVWCVHPFLFEVKDPTIEIDWEHKGFEWVAPEDVSRFPTVPGLQQVVCKLLQLDRPIR